MTRTFKDVPYKVAKERLGVEDSFLYPARAAVRKHVFDAIFYAHEHDAIAEFEKHLDEDESLDAVVTETKGHLITGRAAEGDRLYFIPRRVNGEPLKSLIDTDRYSVGTHKPSGDWASDFKLAKKSNVFVIYQVFRVREAREAVLEIEKRIPYWSPYWGYCRCEWCTFSPRKGDLDKRSARQLEDVVKDFNSGVPLDELEDGLL